VLDPCAARRADGLFPRIASYVTRMPPPEPPLTTDVTGSACDLQGSGYRSDERFSVSSTVGRPAGCCRLHARAPGTARWPGVPVQRRRRRADLFWPASARVVAARGEGADG